MEQQKQRRQSLSPARDDIRNDPRLRGLSETELAALIRAPPQAACSLEQGLHDMLDFDVVTTDAEIDNMSMKELLDRLASLDGWAEETASTVRIGDLRKRLYEHNNRRDGSSGDATAGSYDALSQALSKGTDHDVNRAILQMFFQEFDPKRLHEIDPLLAQYRGCEDELFAEIAWKYPDHANRLVTFSIYASYEADDEYTSGEEEEGEHAGKVLRRPSYILPKPV